MGVMGPILEADMTTKVLLVDDEVAVRRQLRVAMVQKGFDADESGDGLSALEAIERHARQGSPFNVVVTDMVLPDIDGLKLLSIIKSRYPGMKVIVISGYGDVDTMEKVENRRGDGFVSKPFDVEQVTKLFGVEKTEEKAQEAAAPTTSAAAYVLVELDRKCDPMQAFRDLSYENGVLYCDAVRDERYSIVLLTHGRSHEELERQASAMLDGRKGVASWAFVKVNQPYLPGETRSFIDDYNKENADAIQSARTSNRATSYLVVDVDPRELAGLFVRLYFLDEVVELDASLSGDKVILLLQGSDFDHIRRVINGRIRFLEGVLRVHELKVMPFNEM